MVSVTSMKIFCLVFFQIIALTQVGLPLSSDENADVLLKRVEANISTINTITMEVSAVVYDKRPDRVPKVVYDGTLRMMKPNFAWIEFQEKTYKDDKVITAKTLLVSNGKTVWMFDPQKNEYIREEVRSDGRNISLTDALPIGMQIYMFFASRVPHTEAVPTLIGTENLNGKTYSVVEFRDGETKQDEPPVIRQRLYVGADNFVHRMVNEQLKGNYIVEWTLKNIKVNSQMSVADFAYTPPASATAKNAASSSPKLLPVGEVAPDFTVSDEKGRNLKLSDFKGKIIVLDFWSTGCGHSLESRAHLNSIAKKFSHDVVFLSVNVWDNKEAFDIWVVKHRQFDSLLFAIDTTPIGKDIATTLYHVPGLPSHYVIGKNGKIIKSFLGYDGPTTDLEDTIKAIGAKVR